MKYLKIILSVATVAIAAIVAVGAWFYVTQCGGYHNLLC